jgi:hypothetical protein
VQDHEAVAPILLEEVRHRRDSWRERASGANTLGSVPYSNGLWLRGETGEHALAKQPAALDRTGAVRMQLGIERLEADDRRARRELLPAEIDMRAVRAEVPEMILDPRARFDLARNDAQIGVEGFDQPRGGVALAIGRVAGTDGAQIRGACVPRGFKRGGKLRERFTRKPATSAGRALPVRRAG